MEFARKVIPNEQTVRSGTVKDLKNFNSPSSSTQAKKGEQSVSTTRDIKKAVELMGDDIVEISTNKQNKEIYLKNKIGSYDEKWFDESLAKQLKQIEYEKKTNLILSGMQKQMKK